jgi:hypothetical protein
MFHGCLVLCHLVLHTLPDSIRHITLAMNVVLLAYETLIALIKS